jgi:2-methylcitrate dehydratase
LAASGDDFAVMGMHFKLGLYEHQSAGAIAGLIDLLTKHPHLLADPTAIERIRITIYEPAFSIIGDPHKRDPRTRQSADHSMIYIVATLVRKAIQGSGVRGQGSEGEAGGRGLETGITSPKRQRGVIDPSQQAEERSLALWQALMLMPEDYSDAALVDPVTREIMQRIDFRHGGPEFDAKYPDGIPTTVEIEHRTLGTLSSGLVMYPEGHVRNTSGNLPSLLVHKFRRLAGLGVRDVDGLYQRMTELATKSAAEIRELYSFEIEHVRPS